MSVVGTSPAVVAGRRATVLRGELLLRELTPTVAETTFAVGADEPVLAGHYPRFPILPGVCLLELAIRTARALPAVGDAALADVVSTRFVTPVFPGDQVTSRVQLSGTVKGRLACSAGIFTTRGRAASVKLRFVDGGRR